VLHELFAEWVRSAPGFVLVYLIAFGVRLGTFQIHGIVSSIWKLAENVGGMRSEVAADFKSVKDSQSEIKVALAHIEKRLDERPSDDGALRLHIK
jgi:hypothetical protein